MPNLASLCNTHSSCSPRCIASAQCLLYSDVLCNHVCMYVQCPWDQPDKVLFMQIHLVNILLVREKYFQMNPPNAFALQQSKKSDTEQAH